MEWVETRFGLAVPKNAPYVLGELALAPMREMQPANLETQGEIAMLTNLGPLSSLAREKNALPFDHPEDRVWTGKISKNQAIKNKSELPKLIETALDPVSLETYYVLANLKARTRCIDGRLLNGYITDTGLINEALRSRDLGPQVPGGTPAAALVHRIVQRGWDKDTTLGNDIRLISKIYSLHGIRMGGHIDEHKEDHPFDSGCGAIDNMPDILTRITSPDAIGELKGLVRSLMGKSFSADIFDMVQGRMLLLESMHKYYFGEYETNAGQKEYAFKKDAIAVLSENAKKENHPVAKLTGDHKECALVVNLVPGTTFDRDRFWADNHGDVQIFNYDLWRSEQFASILYPTDLLTQTPEEYQKNQLEQRLFLTARIMYAVGTAMVLTDGSLDMIVRSK